MTVLLFLSVLNFTFDKVRDTILTDIVLCLCEFTGLSVSKSSPYDESFNHFNFLRFFNPSLIDYDFGDIWKKKKKKP